MKKIEINSYLLGVAEEERCTFTDLPETESEYFFFIDSFNLVPRLTKTDPYYCYYVVVTIVLFHSSRCNETWNRFRDILFIAREKRRMVTKSNVNETSVLYSLFFVVRAKLSIARGFQERIISLRWIENSSADRAHCVPLPSFRSLARV